MLRATSATQPRWIVDPKDLAFDQEKSNAIAYLADINEASESKNLVLKEGRTATRYQIRALDAVEYEDQLAQAEGQAGTKHSAFYRRAAMLCGMKGLLAVHEAGEQRPVTCKQKRDWQAMTKRIPPQDWVWLGERVMEMTTGKPADPLLPILQRNQACATLLGIVFDELDALDGGVEATLSDEIASDVRVALKRPKPPESSDADQPSGAEVPSLGESDASSSRDSPPDGD